MQKITEEQLRKQVPSIFSAQAHEKTSDKYALIPTIECVRGLEKAGFYPVSAQESTCRNKENRPYAKHLIRFRPQGSVELNGNVPELVMINSHNGTCSYQLRAGIYRLVCTNGLIVGDELFYKSIRHQGDVISKVVESASEIIEIIPEALEVAEEWKQITLNKDQKKIFAQSAALLKWDSEESTIDPERLLRTRRVEDSCPTLWNTFNSVQENIMRGGIKYYDPKSQRRGTTRGVKSVSENARLNTALWNLTKQMAKLAA